MGKPRNALNVTEAERHRMRELFVRGVKVADICRRTGRSDSVVYRATKGLKRPRPRPKSKVATRNARIIKRVVEGGEGQAYPAPLGSWTTLSAGEAVEMGQS